ncbi:ribonuclease H family protein [Liquorilactobacillus capillatus]|uniref:ribonuclease H n=1 Tax=Liquorilactobacillus capillatus DSM 19910 TaxID=1423731 RepID=A0A0R1M4G5_9LACO|nr:ribonuclease H family protein [Liquorilactobacillus capillatus]KRL02681.1 ribonuclease HI [Liquorilactobacillus capillatus DSM 19910]
MIISYRFYAVARGRKKGIYTDWATCLKQVNGFSQARYKGFRDKSEAMKWIELINNSKVPAQSNTKNLPQPQMQVQAEVKNTMLLWTDGGSRNHGNVLGGHVKQDDKAAWAFLLKIEGKEIARSGGEYGATNNRMEIMALLQALSFLKKQDLQNKTILATLDSRYVLDAIQKKWLYSWKKRGWKTASGTEVANKELWVKMAELLPHFKQLIFQWTKGHQKNKGNIFVDQLLNKTMDKMN